ncbi:Large ribosomal subunit protein mL43 [Pleurotus pulmonarius]
MASAARKVAPAVPIFRAQLRSRQSNGHSIFIPQVRKLVFEFCDKWPSSANTRTYLLNHLEDLARENPHVEVVVKQRNQNEPIVRGFYLNGRDKVIPLNEFEVTGIQKKVQLLLDSSGAKIKSLKRSTVESTTEAARGIWSGLHADRPQL